MNLKNCVAAVLLALLPCSSVSAQAASVRIGNFLVTAPSGIAFIVDDAAAFVVDTKAPYYAGTAAPDDSFHHLEFEAQGAAIKFDWGRVGDGVVARFSTNKAVELPLGLTQSWPGFNSSYTATPEGATGAANALNHPVSWQLRTLPKPLRSSATEVVVQATPDQPAYFVAGLGTLPAFDQIDNILRQAAQTYAARRPAATGEWGDFAGAIADNLNNSRIYSSDNHRLAHTVGRGWAKGVNDAPYFCWDSFFNGLLSCLDDPNTGRATVRAILSCATPEGLVPNFGHWGGASNDRSQPPAGAICIWKMQQHWPDTAFLKEVYPALVKWHRWWPTARDGNHDGLLEWGSATSGLQDALYETGWDDTIEFDGAKMVGHTLNADAVDLNSLWAMDAEYLALIADIIGKQDDAAAFRAERQHTLQLMNQWLWNDKMGIYCSRLWDGAERLDPMPSSTFRTGFDAVFFKDEELGQEVARRHDVTIDFASNGAAPMAGVPGTRWSARWTGAFTPPRTTKYRFHIASDDGNRLFVNGRKVADNWKVQGETAQDIDLDLVAGQPVPIVVEYFQHDFGAALHFSVAALQPATGEAAFLTRLTPMNFYPLIAGVPDAHKAQRMLAVMTDPKQFWGDWVLPTVSYQDPVYPQQNYWRGKVWGPVNYLVFQGLQRYASAPVRAEYAAKSVRLFMQNWDARRVCGENYLSTTGTQSSDPHYTWGALLCLTALDNICEVEPDGRVRLNGQQTKTATIKNFPIQGRLYDLNIQPGQAILMQGRKVILKAEGHEVRQRLAP